MTISNRTVTIKNVFATNANTTIPNPPVPGESYRNTSLTATEVGNGWSYKDIVDSAKFNQAMYEYTTICQQLEKYGFLPWSPNTDYPAQGCALGSDGIVYQAKVATGPSSTAVDPTTDTNHNTWDVFYYSSFTANRAMVSNGSGKITASTTTSTELGYVHGVTSAIQTQLNGKQATITGAATTITSSSLTASRALVSNSSGKVAVSSTTSTELGYVHGVTSAIQTQIDNTVKLTGDQTIAGTKTFSSTIAGSINGNAATVTNGVYTTGNQTIAGTKTFSSSPIVPTPATSDNSTKVASTAFVKALNYIAESSKSFGYDGYIKLENGFIIQWGVIATSGTSGVTVNLPTPFSTDEYCAVLAVGNIGWTEGVPPQTYEYTTTTFKVRCNNATYNHWIAVGK